MVNLVSNNHDGSTIVYYFNYNESPITLKKYLFLTTISSVALNLNPSTLGLFHNCNMFYLFITMNNVWEEQVTYMVV